MPSRSKTRTRPASTACPSSTSRSRPRTSARAAPRPSRRQERLQTPLGNGTLHFGVTQGPAASARCSARPRPVGIGAELAAGLRPQARAADLAGIQRHSLSALLTPLRHLAQFELLNLPGAGLRQLGEHHVARHLVAGEVLPAPRHELLAGRRLPGLQLDEGARRLAPFLVGLGHHGGGLHRRMLVERVLDLDRGNVLAAGDDDVLGAVLELDVAVRDASRRDRRSETSRRRTPRRSIACSSDSPSSPRCRGTSPRRASRRRAAPAASCRDRARRALRAAR